MIIRELHPNEWKIYRDIRLESLKNEPLAFLSNYEGMLERTEESWREGLIATTKPRSFILFAIKNNEAIGMIGTYQDNGDEEIGIINLFGVYVRPQYRGTGVAEKLMEEVVKRTKAIKSIKKIRCKVYYDHITAQKFYEKIGFNKFGEAPKLHRDRLELILK